jgi:hypothetical protein
MTIVTQSYACGPYRFTCRLPTIGTTDDLALWFATKNRVPVPGVWDSLERAMLAAVAFTFDRKESAVRVRGRA